MPSALANPCAHPGCRRSTRDRSGRCHDHRKAGANPVSVPRRGIPAEPKVLRGRADFCREDDGTFVTDSWFDYDDLGRRVLSRTDGPAEVVRRSTTGALVAEDYYLFGKLHREDGPAERRFFGTGGVRAEAWRCDGKLHREGDQPADIVYGSDGELYEVRYYRDGLLYRESGPATVIYYPDGRPRVESFYVDGERRPAADGPATIEYFENGSWSEQYPGPDGTLSRIDGPVRKTYDGHGGVEEEWVFRNSFGNPAAILEDLEEDELRIELSRSSYAPLLGKGTDPYAIVAAIGAEVRTVEGIREVLGGAPVEWVRSYESASR